MTSVHGLVPIVIACFFYPFLATTASFDATDPSSSSPIFVALTAARKCADSNDPLVACFREELMKAAHPNVAKDMAPVMAAVASIVNTDDISSQGGRSRLEDTIASAGETAFNTSRDFLRSWLLQHPHEGRRKNKNMSQYILMAATTGLMLMAPVALKVIGFIAAKALIAGKFALALSSMMMLFKYYHQHSTTAGVSYLAQPSHLSHEYESIPVHSSV